MNRKITLHDIKNALLDERFRKILPDHLNDDVSKFLSNPGCACNHPIYRKIAKEASDQLAKYFPQRMMMTPEEADKKHESLSKNNWQVINCHMHELVERLRELGAGPKQLDIARYEDQVTVVINHLES